MKGYYKNIQEKPIWGLRHYMAIIFGSVHLLISGIFYIRALGNAEYMSLIVLIDIPIVLAAIVISEFYREVFKKSFESPYIDFFIFIVCGSLMYAAIGYFIGFKIEERRNDNLIANRQ